jgi:hypothetical protein
MPISILEAKIKLLVSRDGMHSLVSLAAMLEPASFRLNNTVALYMQKLVFLQSSQLALIVHDKETNLATSP